MDELEQSVSEKEAHDFRNTFYQNAKHCKEREKAFIKTNLSVVYFILFLL